MKKSKLLLITLVFVMLTTIFGVVAQATTNDNLADEVYAKASKYGMTSADKVKIERYLTENPVTEDQANQLMSKLNEAITVMENAGETNYSKLPSATQEQLKNIANSAASIIDVTLVFKPQYNAVEIYKNGKLIETITENNGKLSYTGNNMSVVLGVSVIAIIALATVVVVKRKIADEK